MIENSLIIHGPFSEQWLEKINYQVSKFKQGFCKIVVVSYKTDEIEYKMAVDKYDWNVPVDFVVVKDLVNPGFFNINRHIMCVDAGLKAIGPDSLVYKLRNDQSVDFNKVSHFFSKTEGDKILTTNCFTRKDRPYHPSDMFLCARHGALSEYFSMPLMETTHMNVEMTNIELCENNPELSYLPIATESELCRHYLALKNWEFKNTREDSLAALKEYFVVVNSWDIDYRWAKERTNLFKAGAIILPHRFSIEPFKGGPIETASCYMYHNIEQTLPTIVDIFYISLSAFVWAVWDKNKKRSFFSIPLKTFKLYWMKTRREVLKMLPYCFVYKEISRLNRKYNRQRRV
jgi:hypothetical protein